MYPENLAKMVVLTEEQREVLLKAGYHNEDLLYPFKYVDGDEFSDHFSYTRFDKK